MGAEIGPELCEYFTSGGRGEIIAAEFDQQLQGLLKVLRVNLEAHGGIVTGHVLVNIVERPPVQL